jgi:C_GCAxxG_C_C family probable redox protein
MTKADEAVSLFNQGFNCAQAVLSVFAPDFGLNLDMARRISQGFGAGIGRTDNICGSLSGAIMVIGLRYGGLRLFPNYFYASHSVCNIIKLFRGQA